VSKYRFINNLIIFYYSVLYIFIYIYMKLSKYLYLAPGGFTMPYTLGVCQFIKENYSLTNYKFIGASAGSWLSVYLASDMNLTDDIIIDYSKLFENKGIFYKWHNICPFLIDEFTKSISDTSFINKKLIKVSVSNYENKTFSNKLIDDYDNLDELLQLCTISSYIPILSGISIPKRNNLITFDGYFTEPDFEDSKIKLKICNYMFNRKFTLSDVLGKSKININELINLGYYDSIKNKEKLDNVFFI
jgi:hypothetical protein